MGAGSLGGGGYTRRSSRRRSAHRANSEINVTPLVDVMLVLLIIFMVAAPMMTVGVPIDLPKASAKQLETNDKPVTVSIGANGDIFVMKDKVTLETLVPSLSQLVPVTEGKQIQVKADGAVSYEKVMQVTAALNVAGYTKLGLVTEAPSGGIAPAAAPVVPAAAPAVPAP